MTEYGIMIALLTIVAIVAVWALADAHLAFDWPSAERSSTMKQTMFKRMVFSDPIICNQKVDSMKGGVELVSQQPGSGSGAAHGISWCTGVGDGSHEIGNSLNKLSVKYPPGTDLSGVNEESVQVKLDKDSDQEHEKNATDDISGLEKNGSNLVIKLTGNYNVGKRDSVSFAFSGVDTSEASSSDTVKISINGNAPDAGDETQTASL